MIRLRLIRSATEAGHDGSAESGSEPAVLPVQETWARDVLIFRLECKLGSNPRQAIAAAGGGERVRLWLYAREFRLLARAPV